MDITQQKSGDQRKKLKVNTRTVKELTSMELRRIVGRDGDTTTNSPSLICPRY